MFETFTKLYAPYECLGCQAEGSLLCDPCSRALNREVGRCYRCHTLSPAGRTCTSCRPQTKLYAVHAVTNYEGVAKELIGRLKFSGARGAASSIAWLMTVTDDPAEAVVVPLPTATSRVRLRGYDQASLIAKAFASRSGLHYLPGLHRSGQHRQVGSSRKERLSQMKDSFIVRNPSDIRDKHILLVDDVVTTGASLENAASVLKLAGAKRIEAIVFARA